MIDPLGYIITTVRDFPAVSAITPRVRGELAEDEGPPAVVLRRLGVTRSPLGRTGRTGIQGVVIAALCFGVDSVQAAQLYGAVSDAIHQKRARRDAQGRLIYLSLDQSGGNVSIDPDTHWPFETAVINVIAAAQAVA